MYKFVKITEVGEVKHNEKGLQYVQIWVSPSIMLANGAEVLSNQRPKSRVLFGSSENGPGDPLFEKALTKKLTTNQLIEGSIETFTTTSYQPEGYDNPVNTYSCVVFKGENALKIANRALAKSFASVVDENGTITAPENLERPVQAPAVTRGSLKQLEEN